MNLPLQLANLLALAISKPPDRAATTDYYQRVADQGFLPLLPEQITVAERIRKEMTAGVLVELVGYEAWAKTIEARRGQSGQSSGCTSSVV